MTETLIAAKTKVALVVCIAAVTSIVVAFGSVGITIALSVSGKSPMVARASIALLDTR